MRWVLGLLAVVAVCVIGLFWLGPGIVEGMQNKRQQTTTPIVMPEDQAIHDYLRIADLHSDTMLWDRDVLRRSSRGHVDVPRLIAGNVTLQVFAAVTKSPRGQNYDSNTADSDLITPLTMVQLWPRRTWHNLTERALYQAQKLHDAAERSDGTLAVITDKHQLREHLAQWRTGGSVAGLLALEGAHPLHANLDNLQVLYDAGYRMLGLQHFFDNALGGSLHGTGKGGLTNFGREVVLAAERIGYLIDVAHSSPSVVDDVLKVVDQPVVVSHTGIHGACESPRNLRDEQLLRIARAGGLIGIGYWGGAVCDISPAGVARSIKYAIATLGDHAVALGSDFDGATTVGFDVSELAQLTVALRREGLSEQQIAGVMGENQIRFFLDYLPDPI